MDSPRNAAKCKLTICDAFNDYPLGVGEIRKLGFRAILVP